MVVNTEILLYFIDYASYDIGLVVVLVNEHFTHDTYVIYLSALYFYVVVYLLEVRKILNGVLYKSLR